MGSSASRIESVTVYARGARVTRVATLAACAGTVTLGDLPLALVDRSVRIAVTGPAIATAVRVVLAAPADTAPAGAEEAPALRVARRRHGLAEAEVARVDAAISQLAAAPVVVEDSRDAAPAPWGAVLSARRTLVSARAEREVSLRAQAAAAAAELEVATVALRAADQADAQASIARDARVHELRKAIEIELVAAPASGSEAALDAVELRVEYQVRAARWAPSYVARLDEQGATLELRAVVAQATQEDWSGVALVLSTAEPAQLADLPELAPQRIGRRQDAPVRRGFRAAPAGAEALYADYDRTRSSGPLVPAAPAPPAMESVIWDEDSSRDKSAFETPPAGWQVPPLPPPSYVTAPMSASPAPRAGGIASMMMRASATGAPSPANAPMDTRARAEPSRGASPGFGGGGAPPAAPMAKRSAAPELAAPPPAPTPLLDYDELRMPSPRAADRGRLSPAVSDPGWATAGAAADAAAASIAQLPLPRGCADAWAHAYDYAFTADGRVDVASDGAWHSLAIAARPTTATVRHVSVPREQADVYRVAAIANPLDGPLLRGPIDVYDRGRFLVTSEIDGTPPAARVEVGLGVDPQVKIARNTQFHEEATGMLRGGLRLVHGIEIDVDNLSPRPIDLEVRERLPVVAAGDDEVEVLAGRVEPPWERWTPDPDAPTDQRLRGGYRWRANVAAGAKLALRAGYEVRIAGKHELVGGNRRES